MPEVEHIIVTGFVGTGSSAVIDVLKEFDNCGVLFNRKDYEDYILTAPGLLFDLEWKLFYNNDPHRSDEAVDTFMKMMKKLYENDFRWFGSYKRYIGPEFINNANEFIKAISMVSQATWYYRYKESVFSPLRYFYRFFQHKLRDESYILSGSKIIEEKCPTHISYPTEEEFYTAARRFVQNYMKMVFNKDCDVMIHDHLIWPMHARNIDKYFDEKCRFIIVHRDARDVFLSNKYLWGKNGVATTYPLEVHSFVKYWERLLRMGRGGGSEKVMHVNFEDLIYNYEIEVKRICDFCALDMSHWKNKKKFFHPDFSIKNTQVFSMNQICQEEGAKIAAAIPDLIYYFPYENMVSVDQMFI